MTRKKLLLALSTAMMLSGALLSCEKHHVDSLTKDINTWIAHTMYEAYLWEDHMPAKVYPGKEADPFALFEKLCYRTLDRWSFLTDDYESTSASLSGVETTFGWSLSFGSFSNTGNLFAIISYVYAHSPAAEAGLGRGTIITKIDGQEITKQNYTALYDNASVTITLGQYDTASGTIKSSGETLTLTARKMDLDPIQLSKVLNLNGHKIGYLCYTDFYPSSEDRLSRICKDFKDQGIQDMVLDLRYNLGGNVSTAIHLSSLLAPASCLDGKTTLITYKWNNLYQAYWTKKDPTQIKSVFSRSLLEYNLNLGHIYILVGANTASASEFTLSGLMPYAKVTLIGSTTRGKYTGAGLIRGDKDNIRNWAMQLILFRYANANGVTDFKNGFDPDYPVKDNLLGGCKPLGDPEEPLLAKAISLITGSTKAAAPEQYPMPENFVIDNRLQPRRMVSDGLIMPVNLSHN